MELEIKIKKKNRPTQVQGDFPCSVRAVALVEFIDMERVVNGLSV